MSFAKIRALKAILYLSGVNEILPLISYSSSDLDKFGTESPHDTTDKFRIS
jgi:hypothetical protein